MARTPTPAQPVGTNYPSIKTKAAIAAVEEYVRMVAEGKAAEARAKALKAELLALMDGSPVVFIGALTVSVTEVPETPSMPERPITREMIGQVLPAKAGRSGYRTLSVR